MKFKHFLMSGLIAALAGFFVVGCNENPDDPGNGGDDDSAAAVTNLAAVSLGTAGSVGLVWDASTTSGATYEVSWMTTGGTTIDSKTVTGTSTTITGLTTGTRYTFTVVATASGVEDSDPVSIEWSPANRYVNDRDAGGILRVYARSVSGKGSGIVVQQDGAYNALTAVGSPGLNMIHLIADVGTNSIRIGAPVSFTDFSAHASFRTDVELSDNYYELAPSIGLDGWYNEDPLNVLFATNNEGNFIIPDQLTGGAGAAFVARWGNPGSERYARIFVLPGSNGKLVQFDSSNDPFIELQISYQPTDRKSVV